MLPGYASPAQVNHVAQSGYINNTLNEMNPLTPGITQVEAARRYQLLQALDNAIQETNRAPQTITTAAPLLVPYLAQLQQQKASIESSIAALTGGIEQAFTEDFYGDNGYNLDPFFDRVTDLLEAANTQLAHDAAVQRLLALQVQAAAPAAAADDMDI
jgi:hypothetical protein